MLHHYQLRSKSLRDNDFDEIYANVASIIEEYIQNPSNTWYKEAIGFQQRLEQVIKDKRSLIDLVEETRNFCQSLRSWTNWGLTLVFTDDQIRPFSGSTLKQKLEAATSKDPYHFIYLRDEVERGRFGCRVQPEYQSLVQEMEQGYQEYDNALMRSIEVTDLSYLTDDSLRTLERARQDQEFKNLLKKQSSSYRLINFQTLFEQYVQLKTDDGSKRFKIKHGDNE